MTEEVIETVIEGPARKGEGLVWTDDENRILIEGLEGGLSYAELLDLLPPHRTRSSVAGRIARMKIKLLSPEEKKARRLANADRWPIKPKIKAGGRPRGPNYTGPQPVRSSQTLTTRPLARTNALVTKRYVPQSKLLPYVMVKNGTLIHVYARHPHVLNPLASFEKRSSHWVRRDDPRIRFDSVPAAVRSMEPW